MNTVLKLLASIPVLGCVLSIFGILVCENINKRVGMRMVNIGIILIGTGVGATFLAMLAVIWMA